MLHSPMTVATTRGNFKLNQFTNDVQNLRDLLAAFSTHHNEYISRYQFILEADKLKIIK